MRFLGGLLALAVVLLLVVNIFHEPAYYVCSGTKTPHGQPAQPIQHVGLEIEETPMLDRLLFQTKNAGMLILEEIEVLVIKEDSAGILSIASFDGDYRGQFARISRHLDVSTGLRDSPTEYDLYCSETKLAPV